MSSPFIGEIRMLPYSYPPRGWAYCQGQLLSIAQNTALYSIIGTMYGGDGRITMGLPNLQGRTPLGHGTGPGLFPNRLGITQGHPAVSLTLDQLPSHTHETNTYFAIGNTNTPSTAVVPAVDDDPIDKFYIAEQEGQPRVNMAQQALADAGLNHAHENRQPYLVTPFCICLEGIYPSRN